MTRDEHLEWCKGRALEYVDNNDLTQAFASMASDLGKHKETEGHAGIELGMLLLMNGGINSQDRVKDFINGFN